MPAPSETALSSTAKQYFADKRIQLPMKWSDMGVHFPCAFTQAELSTGSNSAANLFHEPTLNSYHTGAARTLARSYEKFLDDICACICSAIDQWMKLASVVSVTVNGPVGTLMPAGVEGPELQIMTDAPQATERELKHSAAIAAALNESWTAWQQGLSGILSYPGFNGAPMPNVPAPLVLFVSEAEVELSPEKLAERMAWHFDDPDALHSQDLFDALSRAFYTHFQEFKLNTLVTGVTVVAAAPPPVIPDEVGIEEEALADDLDTTQTADKNEALISQPDTEDSENVQTNAEETEEEIEQEAQTDTEEIEETEELEETLEEPEELLPPPPVLVGMVIPTPGNFV